VAYMSLDYSITLDLTSIEDLNENTLLSLKKLVSRKSLPNELKEALVEALEDQRGSKLEIFIEALDVSEDAEEDIQDFIAEVDEEILEIASGSIVCWVSKYPYLQKTFEKNGFSWNYDEDSENDNGLDLLDWEDYE
jgi:hypothetical protein